MAGPFGAQAGRKKAEGVADALNRLIQNLVLKSAKSGGIRDYFYTGVIGYGSQVGPALGGALAGKLVVPVSEIASTPLRVEPKVRKVEDGAGGLVDQPFNLPIWVEPVAAGKTPMCQALALAQQVLTPFVGRFPASHPPIVLNVSDGRATDGDPEPAAAALKCLSTTDGNVLLFNAHLSSRPDKPIEFPSSENQLPDDHARLLFRMSSPLPPKLMEAARSEGFRVGSAARGFVFNADLVAVIRFLDIGTRVSQNLR